MKQLSKFKRLKKQNTKLSKDEQKSFDNLKSDVRYTQTLSDSYDYDIQGAFKKIYKENNGDKKSIEKAITKESSEQHIFTDEFKKSNHPTFSNESKYSNFLRRGGKWDVVDVYSNKKRIDSYNEVETKEGQGLDTFYKNNKHVAGMYMGGKNVSRNKYSELPKKNLDSVITLEKYRGLMKEKNAPELNFKLSKEQKKQFDYYANNIGVSKKEDRQNTKESIISRIMVGDDSGGVTKRQERYANKLYKYGQENKEQVDAFKARKRNIKNMESSYGSSQRYMDIAEDYDGDGKSDVKLIEPMKKKLSRSKPPLSSEKSTPRKYGSGIGAVLGGFKKNPLGKIAGLGQSVADFMGLYGSIRGGDTGANIAKTAGIINNSASTLNTFGEQIDKGVNKAAAVGKTMVARNGLNVKGRTKLYKKGRKGC